MRKIQWQDRKPEVTGDESSSDIGSCGMDTGDGTDAVHSVTDHDSAAAERPEPVIEYRMIDDPQSILFGKFVAIKVYPAQRTPNRPWSASPKGRGVLTPETTTNLVRKQYDG